MYGFPYTSRTAGAVWPHTGNQLPIPPKTGSALPITPLAPPSHASPPPKPDTPVTSDARVNSPELATFSPFYTFHPCALLERVTWFMSDGEQPTADTRPDMPPSPELSSLDYTPDNAAYIAHCMAQAAHWACIRKALLSRGIKGRGLHLATSRIGVWTSKAARL